jgi:uncharacterized DUF497 family protein
LSDFEAGKAKDKENRRKHGLSLDVGRFVFDGLYFETVDRRRDYGEVRLVAVGPAIGLLGDKLLSVTYTWRDDRRRFISVRQASGNEGRHLLRRYARVGGSGLGRGE